MQQLAVCRRQLAKRQWAIILRHFAISEPWIHHQFCRFVVFRSFHRWLSDLFICTAISSGDQRANNRRDSMEWTTFVTVLQQIIELCVCRAIGKWVKWTLHTFPEMEPHFTTVIFIFIFINSSIHQCKFCGICYSQKNGTVSHPIGELIMHCNGWITCPANITGDCKDLQPLQYFTSRFSLLHKKHLLQILRATLYFAFVCTQ